MQLDPSQLSPFDQNGQLFMDICPYHRWVNFPPGLHDASLTLKAKMHIVLFVRYIRAMPDTLWMDIYPYQGLRSSMPLVSEGQKSLSVAVLFDAPCIRGIQLVLVRRSDYLNGQCWQSGRKTTSYLFVHRCPLGWPQRRSRRQLELIYLGII